MSLSHLPEDQWPDECRRLYAQLAAWLANVDRERPALRFDGTISSLIEHFERHDLSPYQAVKYNSRDTYDDAHRLLRKTVGARQLSKLAGIDFLQWEENLKKPAEPGGSLRITRSHKTMSHLRRLLRWGVVLELPHCQRLTAIISQMDFEAPQVRSEYMTFEQAAAIIEAAHEQGRPSIALGQALQFELMLRQKDVIGEWITDTSTTAGIRHTAPNSLKPKRWDNGLLWSHIDGDMILTKLVTKTARTTRAVAQFDLKLYPLVMAELARIPAEKRIGPVVINEYTHQPYTHDTYREL